MKRIDFEHGTVTGNILGAALPMLVAQILNLLYNIVDRIYIARIPNIGTAALGAVGLCFPLIVVITAFSNLFGSGGAPLFSIYRGKGEPQRAANVMNTSFTMVCVCAVVLMAVGFIFARPLLVLFGASTDALVYAYPYLMIYLIGTLPSMIATGMNPFINAQGYSTIGMTSVAVGAVANLLLDPLFIFVLGFGVQGAAIATVISQALSAVFVFVFLTRKSELKVRFLKKKEVPQPWVYYCCGQSVTVPNRFFAMPSWRNRIMGVLMYLHGIKGFLHWGFNFYNSQYSISHIDPFFNTHASYAFPSGDAFLVYPGPDEKPMSSIRAQVQREALDDLNALTTLESVVGRERVVALIMENAEEPFDFEHYPHLADYILHLRERMAEIFIQEEQKY